MAGKFKIGDIVRTILGFKKVVSMNKEVVRFDNGFAPIDRVIKHEHKFLLQYRTGNAHDGKTEVLKCECGQWAIRPYGAKEYIFI